MSQLLISLAILITPSIVIYLLISGWISPKAKIDFKSEQRRLYALKSSKRKKSLKKRK